MILQRTLLRGGLGSESLGGLGRAGTLGGLGMLNFGGFGGLGKDGSFGTVSRGGYGEEAGTARGIGEGGNSSAGSASESWTADPHFCEASSVDLTGDGPSALSASSR